MLIERAKANHIASMALIHAASFEEGQIWSPAVLLLQLDLPGAFGLISNDRGFVLARVAGDEAEILTLAVAPTARRKGVGAALVAGAKARAACMGATEMFLEVATTNEEARALYSSLGFHEVGHRRAYYAGGGDALVLQASLPLRHSVAGS